MAKVTAPMKPGPMQPSKYSHTGPNYQKFGEQTQNGFYYDATVDQYFVDPKQHKQDLQNQGVLPKDPGLADTLVPIAAGGAALAGGQYLGNHAGDWISEVKNPIKGLFGGDSPATNTATNSGLLNAGGSSGSWGAIGTNVDGSIIEGPIGSSAGASSSAANAGTQAPGGLFSVGSTSGNILGGAGIGLGAYTAFQGIKEGNPIESGLGGLGVAGGLSQLGYAIPGWGWAAAIGIPIAASLFGHHESTRDIAKKHTSSLMKTSKDDPQWQNYVAAMREQYNHPPPDPEHPFGGKYKTWEEAKAAGLEAPNLTGVYGNLKTFGPDWAKYSEQQRIDITQGIINAGLYDSKKGEVIITNEDEAKKIRDNIMAGNGAVNAVKPPMPPTSTAAPVTATQPQYVNPVPKLPMQKPSGMMYDYNKG